MEKCSEDCPVETNCEGICHYPEHRITVPETKMASCSFCGSPIKNFFDIRRCCIDGITFDTKTKKNMSSPEPATVKNDQPAVWDLVLLDMVDRDKSGRKKYGTPLQPHNGRDALVDAYQEALDLVVYLRQAIFERNGK